MVVETASGNTHYWFAVEGEIEDMRTKIKLLVNGKRLPIDVKATGYVMWPGSTIGTKPYTFREGKGLKPPEDLEPLPKSVIELLANAERTRTITRSLVNTTFGTPELERLRNYIRRLMQ